MDQAPTGFWSTEASALLQQLQAPPEGLSGEEASRGLTQCGPDLPKLPTRSGSRWLLLGQFKSPIILVFAAGLSFHLGDHADGKILLAIVAVSGLLAPLRVIVGRLASMENFGTMNILCSDTSGTITEARLRLTSPAILGRSPQ